MDAKNKYRELCKTERTIPVFSRDWWLDAVCGAEGWDVVIVEKGAQVVASLPYYLSGDILGQRIVMPKLTQTMGPWIKYPEGQKHDKRLSYEKELMTDLIKGLPKFRFFRQNFHYSITNWLPFYWQGFSQTTRYTYVIEDLNDLDAVFSNFSHSKRKNIKRAEKSVTVNYDLSAKDFYDNHKLTLSKQGQEIGYSYDLFSRIYDAAYTAGCGKAIYCVDEENNIHSGLFVIWDECSAYDLISTIDPDFRNSGSASLLIREIIKYVADKTEKFDFEGSMIEAVERSFRSFGGLQKQFFSISKDSQGPLVKFIDLLLKKSKQLKRKIRR
jgi:hypothetical protein